MRFRRGARKTVEYQRFQPPFDGLSEPPTADYRGVPSGACPCGCEWLVIVTRFDMTERLPGMYLLDARCASCGSWVTPPTPIDDRFLIDWEGMPE